MQEKTDNVEQSNNDNNSEKEKQEVPQGSEKDLAENQNDDINGSESKNEKNKEAKRTNQSTKAVQEKTKESTSDNQKEKKLKRPIKEIIGLNSKKDVIVQFKDSNSPEIVKLDEMKSNYTRDLLSFYESKFVLVSNIPNTK